MKRSIESLFEEFRSSGDPASLGEVYDRTAPELFHLARHLCGAGIDPEDVLASTFLTAIERRTAFDPGRRLMPWLVGILTRQATNAARSVARRPDPLRLENARAAPDPALDAEEAELAGHLDRALLELPESFRSVLILRLRHGLTAAEIAHGLQRPPGTVRSQMARGLEHLRRALRPGLAGSAAVVIAGTNDPVLASVRAQVLTQAAPALAPIAAVTSLTGVFAVNKLVMIVLVSLVALSTWHLTSGNGEAPAERPLHDVSSSALVPPITVSLAAPLDDPSRDEGRAHATVPPATAPSTPPTVDNPPQLGSLLVHARRQGSPLAVSGALVILTSHTFGSVFPSVRTCLTDELGAAFFPDLRPSLAHVQLLRGDETDVTILPGELTDLSLPMFEGIQVEGVVVDGRGRPVPDAAIWVSERWRIHHGHVLSYADGSGCFRLDSISPEQSIGARKDGYGPSALQTVLARDGDSTGVRIVLERAAGGLEGRVVDRTGRAVSEAQLLIGSEDVLEQHRADAPMSYAPPPTAASVHEDGTFAIDSLPAGLHALRVRAPGHAPAELEVLVPERGLGNVDVVLEQEARLTGVILDHAGNVISGADIRVGAPGLFLTSTTVSRPDGGFLLSGLPGGEVRVQASHRSRGRAADTLLLQPGQTADWRPMLDRQGTIRGSLSDAAGRPLEGWTLVVRRARETVGRAGTDARGRFSLSGLEAAPYTLLVNGPGGWRSFPHKTLRDVLPDGPDLSISVSNERRASISGRVLDPDGTVAIETRVSVWHAGERLFRTFTTDAGTGTFAIIDLPPGECYLSAESRDFPKLDLGRHLLELGDELQLSEAHFAHAGRLQVSVDGLTEQQRASLVFEVRRDSDDDPGSLKPIETGGDEWLSKPLASGPYELVSRADSLVSRRDTFTIKVGAVTYLDLRFEAAGHRIVHFARPAGSALARRLSCSVQDAHGVEVWRQENIEVTGGQRSVRVSAVPGSYRLVARTSDGRRAEGTFVINGFEGLDPPLTVTPE